MNTEGLDNYNNMMIRERRTVGELSRAHQKIIEYGEHR
jgi:hypothetical protein